MSGIVRVSAAFPRAFVTCFSARVDAAAHDPRASSAESVRHVQFTRLAGYSESGGSFPLYHARRKASNADARLGLELRTRRSHRGWGLRTWANAVYAHRGAETATGDVAGLTSFSYDVDGGRKLAYEAGVELASGAGDRTQTRFGLNASTREHAQQVGFYLGLTYGAESASR